MKSTRGRGQILVFVVVLLLIISITVISISMVAQRNALQVTGNVDYERSYNASQTLLIESIPKLAALELSLQSLAETFPGADCAITEPSGPTFVCGLVDETSPNRSRRNVISISEANIVQNYPIDNDGYFDVVLDRGGGSFFNDQLNLTWSIVSAIDLELIYTDSVGRLRNVKQVINQTGVFDSTGADNTLQISNLGVVDGQQSINVNLNSINRPALTGGAVRFNYLRVSPINRTDYITLLSIAPGVGSASSLPDQVRNIETFSYETQSVTGAAPVIISQIPKSPQLGLEALHAFNFVAIKQSLCGNGVPEGAEQCDDGNLSVTDSCMNNCTVAFCGDGLVRDGVEQCDDANLNNLDACTNSCQNARCGDGIVRTGVEQCDGGPGCTPTCTFFVAPPPPPPPQPYCIGGNTCCVSGQEICDYCSQQDADSYNSPFPRPGARRCPADKPDSIGCQICTP